jgi:hypothetical protein
LFYFHVRFYKNVAIASQDIDEARNSKALPLIPLIWYIMYQTKLISKSRGLLYEGGNILCDLNLFKRWMRPPQTYSKSHLIYQNWKPNHLTSTDVTGKAYLTSGSNEGPNCYADKIYHWCSVNETGVPMRSYIKTAASPATDMCLVFNADSAANSTMLTHTSCTNPALPFICEATCKSPVCPSECLKNVNLIEII